MHKLTFLIISYPYYEFATATLVDGLQQLGHNTWGYNSESNNYLKPVLTYNKNKIDVVIHANPTLGDINLFPDKPKIVLFPNDRWQIPNATKIKVDEFEFSKFKFDACFYRDYDGSAPDKFSDIVFPFEYGIERRYLEACKDKPKIINRPHDISFFGQQYIHDRRSTLRQLQASFKCNFGTEYKFILQ